MSETKPKPKRIRKLVKARVKREYKHHYYLSKDDALVFHFVPGKEWEIGGDYPGDPVKKIVNLNYFRELNTIGILQGVYKNG